MYSLIELTKQSDGTPILVNPAMITVVEPSSTYSTVTVSTQDRYYVNETPAQIQKKVDQSRLIYSNEPIEQCDRNVKDMTQEELNVLSDRYIGEKDEFANFDTFWNRFLSDDPGVEEVYELMSLLQDWGYQLEEVIA